MDNIAQSEEHLTGPIPWVWLLVAHELHGKCLGVGLVLWKFQEQHREVITTGLKDIAELLNTDPQAVRRAIIRLEAVGLITVERRKGLRNRIIINQIDIERNTRMNSLIDELHEAVKAEQAGTTPESLLGTGDSRNELQFLDIGCRHQSTAVIRHILGRLTSNTAKNWEKRFMGAANPPGQLKKPSPAAPAAPESKIPPPSILNEEVTQPAFLVL